MSSTDCASALNSTTVAGLAAAADVSAVAAGVRAEALGAAGRAVVAEVMVDMGGAPERSVRDQPHV